MGLALLDSILDGRQRSDDSLQRCRTSCTVSLYTAHCTRSLICGTYSRVGDLVGLLVLRNVKVDPDEDLFALEGDVGDGELAREGHGG
jgi:hypothetical protein